MKGQYSDLLTEGVESTAVITINRPSLRNALRLNTFRELRLALRQYASDRHIRAIIVTGAGDAFSSGADINELLSLKYRTALTFVKAAHALLDQIETNPKPIIAAVNGTALGSGCDLSLACDLSIASERAVFGWPSASLGLVTAFGGNGRAFSLLGAKKTKELFLLGERFTARQAKEIGLVNEVTTEDQLMRRCLELGKILSHKATIQLGMMKRLFRVANGLQAVDRLEEKYFAACFRTRDTREGLSAFMEKRQPVFLGE